MPLRATLVLQVMVGLSIGSNASRADEAARIAFFEQKIRPVLVEHCYECHSTKAEKLKGGLLLDSKAGWEAGGDSAESIILPGHPDDSLLIQYVRYEDGLEMPPEGKLPDAVIADLVTWVETGAADPRTAAKIEAKRADKTWWSLQPLKKSPAGSAKGATAIDEFILAELAENNLAFNPPADARSLIRRMTYDVIGLPPTAEEVDHFATAYEENPQAATEALVDRLLESPHYGEQWGRHWLDVVRFGESVGFERNVIIDDLWPFRDYVIQSINADKPFNRFIIEHIAGDVIGKDQPEIEVGSAFLVAGPYDDVKNQDVAAQASIRAATLDEVITATSSAFLGLTINCARCHDHKFDPIPTEDYYRLRAAYEGIQHGRRVVATKKQRHQHATESEPLQAERRKLAAKLETLETSLENRAKEELSRRSFARSKIDPQFTEERFDPVAAKVIKLLMHAGTDKPTTAVGSRLVEFEIWTSGDNPRNVALSSSGAHAAGARSTFAEDFPEAYGPQFTIDGRFGEQWFIGDPAELVVTLPRVETVDRIAFSNAKGTNIQDKAQGATPCEYEIHVSLDGQTWQSVADSFDRTPWTVAHGAERLRREVVTAREAAKLDSLTKQTAAIGRKLEAIQPLSQVWVGNHLQPEEFTRLHIGGDPMKPADVIPPSGLEVLNHSVTPYELPADAPESERRLALANWITADDNPLTARVLANRVWHYHFGTGIVDTPSDLGFLGGRPTHPELLDWLANRLIESGWRLKPLHREILLSQTYRQSAAYREDAAAIDSDSRLLWRFPPRRLTAEEIRDTMLLVAGQLQGHIEVASSSPARMGRTSSLPTASIGGGRKAPTNKEHLAGGPGFRLYKMTQNNVCTYFPLDQHGPETYRRAVYHQNARASIVDLLNDFDLPDIAFASPTRASTTTPLQALTLLNHSFTLDMAAALADRATRLAGSSEPARIADAVYRLTLQRWPSASERLAAAELVRVHGTEALCRAVLNLNEVLYVE